MDAGNWEAPRRKGKFDIETGWTQKVVEICPHLPFVPPLKFQHASTVCWYRFLHQGNKKIYRSFCTSPAPSPRRASGVAGSEENISPWPHKENPQKTQHKRVSWLDLGWLCDMFMLAAARRFRLNQTQRIHSAQKSNHKTERMIGWHDILRLRMMGSFTDGCGTQGLEVSSQMAILCFLLFLVFLIFLKNKPDIFHAIKFRLYCFLYRT